MDSRQNGMPSCGTRTPLCCSDAGESIKAPSVYLGHADPGFTLRVSTHLLPSSEDRTRRAIDAGLGHGPDGLATA